MALLKLDFTAFSSLTDNTVSEVVKAVKKNSFDAIKKAMKDDKVILSIENVVKDDFKNKLSKEMTGRNQVTSGKINRLTKIYFDKMSVDKKADTISLSFDAGINFAGEMDEYRYYNTDGRRFDKLDAIREWVTKRVEMGTMKAVFRDANTKYGKKIAGDKKKIAKRIAYAIYAKERANPAEQQKKRSNRFIKNIISKTSITESENIREKAKKTYSYETGMIDKKILVHDAVLQRVLFGNMSAIINIISGFAIQDIRKYVHTPYFWQKERIGRMFGKEAKKAFSLLK